MAHKVDGLDALIEAAERLIEVSPERFVVVLKLCRTYVAAFDRPDESPEIFESRLAELRAGKTRFSA